jgi:hypothetical protein
MALPKRFCWSRFGTEAGEKIDAILSRKETERVANSGIFLWGIGSALAPSMKHLIQLDRAPRVIFSPIRSAPRPVDVDPKGIVRWTAGRTLDGDHYELPAGSIVTSRVKSSVRRGRHYALVCASTSKLAIDLEAEAIVLGEVRNLLTDNPVGASQVTAIVRRSKEKTSYSSALYPAAIIAELVFPFFIELTNPFIIDRGYDNKRPLGALLNTEHRART